MGKDSESAASSQAEPREIFGHNTEITVRGRPYHVQTENVMDAEEPTVTTLIYQEGCLVEKLSNSYRDLLDKPGFLKSLERRVKNQHLQALSLVKGGKLGAGRGEPRR
jgi:hypothetical protein